MNRRPLILILLCALTMFGQQRRASRAPEVPKEPTIVSLDATVTDSSGQPVSGLSAEDFQVTQAGEPRKIANFAWFDTRNHTAAIAEPLDALDLTPDEIHRNILLILDDLRLSPEQAAAMQQAVRHFIEEQLAPGDQMAIQRLSSGRGSDQQMTGDRARLAALVERIQPVGRGYSDKAIGSAIWQGIRWAAEGLRGMRGRKAVILFSEHLAAPVAPVATADHFEFARRSLATAAHDGMMVFYTVNSTGGASPPQGSTLAWLIRETGGTAAPDLASVLRDQQGFYVLGLEATPQIDLGGTPQASKPAVIELRRKDLSVRWRFGFFGRQQRHNTVAPLDRTVAMQQAQLSALGGSEIRTQVTALFLGFSRSGAVIDVIVHMDGRDLSVLRDTKGVNHMSTEFQVAAYGDTGRVTSPPPRAYTLDLTDNQLALAKRNGMVFSAQLTVPGAGGYEVRGVVADGLADRFGTAMQFLEIPAVTQGQFGLTGLLLRSEAAAAAKADSDTDVPGQAGVRNFKAGASLAFTYGVFNPATTEKKEGQIETRTRIYATGRLVYEGRPVVLSIPPVTGQVPTVNGKVTLDEHISPGEYLLEVEARDMVARDVQPRIATQSMTFRVRE